MRMRWFTALCCVKNSFSTMDDAMDSLRLATESARNFTVEAHKINFDQDSDYDALSGLCAYVNIISRDLQEIYLYLDQAIDKLKYDKIL